MKRLVAAAILFAVFPVFALRASACSDVACLDSGMELRSSFVTTIEHDGRPLRDATVLVTKYVDGTDVPQFSGVSDAEGKVHIVALPVGEYWVRVQFLGIHAALHCFHVASRPSRKAKSKLKYSWGDMAPATRRVAGRLVYCEPGKGPSQVLNAIRCMPVGVDGARFTLQNSTSRATYTETSNKNGDFVFPTVPDGTYVLHVEGGSTPTRKYDSVDVLLDVTPEARLDSILLTRREPTGGSCGGTSLDLKNSEGR